MNYSLLYHLEYGNPPVQRDIHGYLPDVNEVFAVLNAAAAAGVVVDWY